jgi:hypothetical protein
MDHLVSPSSDSGDEDRDCPWNVGNFEPFDMADSPRRIY